MAPEGRIILAPLLGLAVLAGVVLLLAPHSWLQGVTGFIWVLAGLSLVFFRDPVRVPPTDPHAFVSPADGKVVAIQPIEYDEHIGGEALQVAIFLSLFNVHVQRVPADGRVDSTRYQSGRFLAAFKPQASKENEQAVTYFTGNGGKFTVKQIAGILARRVICHMCSQSAVQRGDRLGFIRFGSRVEIIVPADFQLQVTTGKRVKGATTIIGYFSS